MTLFICPVCKKRIRDHKSFDEVVDHYDDASSFVSHVNTLVTRYGKDVLKPET